ncbi:hypothetical protein LINPERHAP1_LOCUS23092 [Linum perenne]
MQRSFR